MFNRFQKKERHWCLWGKKEKWRRGIYYKPAGNGKGVKWVGIQLQTTKLSGIPAFWCDSFTCSSSLTTTIVSESRLSETAIPAQRHCFSQHFNVVPAASWEMCTITAVFSRATHVHRAQTPKKSFIAVLTHTYTHGCFSELNMLHSKQIIDSRCNVFSSL